MPAVRFGFRPFPEQVEFFRRKLNMPTARWTDLWREDHAHGFMVAGVARAELLDDLRTAVMRASEKGVALDAFKRDFRALVERHGWEPRGGVAWRARVIYDTNVRQAFNAGRYAQLTDPDLLAVRPFWQYRHNDRGVSVTPRPLHQKWHGTVLRHDDPWWKTHFPMNGWGCKCGVRALSARDLEKLGKAGPDAAPNDGTDEWIDKVTGEVHTVPRGVDPGFDFNVGEASRALPSARRFGERVMKLPPVWRERALADVAKRVDDWGAAFEPWARQALAQTSAPIAATREVGFLPERAIRELEERFDVRPPTALVTVDRGQMTHLVRATKRDRGQALPDELALALPQLLASSDALFWNLQEQALVLASELPDGRYATIIVRVNFRESRGTLKGRVTNAVRTASIVDSRNLRAPWMVRLDDGGEL